MTIVMVAGFCNLNEKLLRQVSTRVTREGSTDYNSILDQDLEALRENSNSEQPHTVNDQGYVLPKLEGTRKRRLGTKVLASIILDCRARRSG